MSSPASSLRDLLVAAGEQEESRQRLKLSYIVWQVALAQCWQVVPDFLLLACCYQEVSALIAVCFHKLYDAAASALTYGLAHLRSDLIGCVRLGYV